VAEVGATQERAYDAILAHLAKLAARRHVEQIRAFVPVDDPFALHCRSYGAEQSISTRPDGGASCSRSWSLSCHAGSPARSSQAS